MCTLTCDSHHLPALCIVEFATKPSNIEQPMTSVIVTIVPAIIRNDSTSCPTQDKACMHVSHNAIPFMEVNELAQHIMAITYDPTI